MIQPGSGLDKFLLIRLDCTSFTKEEVLKHRKVNVYYFWESAATECLLLSLLLFSSLLRASLLAPNIIPFFHLVQLASLIPLAAN